MVRVVYESCRSFKISHAPQTHIQITYFDIFRRFHQFSVNFFHFSVGNHHVKMAFTFETDQISYAAHIIFFGNKPARFQWNVYF